MIGSHGRGITEYYGIPVRNDQPIPSGLTRLVGCRGRYPHRFHGYCSCSRWRLLCWLRRRLFTSGGGSCPRTRSIAYKRLGQRINSSAFVYSASLPAMLATVSSAALAILASQPSLISALQANVLTFRQQLSRIERFPLPALPHPSSSSSSLNLDGPSPCASPHTPNKDAIISIPSHPSSALIHIFLLNPPPTLEQEERLLQEIVDEAMTSGSVLITRARRLRGQETFEPEPSLKVCISGAFTRKEVEKAGQALRQALMKVCGSECFHPGHEGHADIVPSGKR